jgi:hypothetical protein
MSHRGEKKRRFWHRKPKSTNVIPLKKRKVPKPNICFACDMLISSGAASIGHPNRIHSDRRGRRCECPCSR